MKSLTLTPRQLQVAALLIEACSDKEIGQKLGITDRTVKAHFHQLYKKFGITSGIKRVKLAVLLYRRELIDEDVTDTRANND